MQRRGSGHRLERPAHRACGWRLRIRGRGPISAVERLARASASPTRSGPEGSSRNEPRLGRCPASHLFPFMPLRCGKPLAGKGLAWWPLRDDASGCRRTSVPSGTMGCSDHRYRRIAPHSGAQRSRPYRPLRTICAREEAALWIVSFPLPQIDGARETWGAPNEASLPTVSAAAKDRFGPELSLEHPERIGRMAPPDRPARGEICPPLLPCARKEKSRSRGRAVARCSRTAPSACPQRWWPAATTLG